MCRHWFETKSERPFLVARIDQLEEQVCTALSNGQVADFVHDQQGCARTEADLFNQTAFPFSFGQPLNQFRQGSVIDAFALLDSGHAKRGGQMALARARRSWKWTTSPRVMKSSCARAMIRSRSRDGWKEKSKLSSVFGGVRRAVVIATPTRRSSRQLTLLTGDCRWLQSRRSLPSRDAEPCDPTSPWRSAS
mgnify:CR=1 FL=1